MKTVLDGVNMSRRLAQDAEHGDTPVLMVTSIANTDYAALFPSDDQVHMHGFMTKPIAPQKLLRHVGELLK